MTDVRTLQEQLIQIKEERLKRLAQPIWSYIPDNTKGHDQLCIHVGTQKYKLVFGGNQSGKTLVSAAEVAWRLLGLHPFRPELNLKPQKIWVISTEYRTIYEGVYRHLRPDGKDNNGMGFLPQEKIIKFGPKVVGHDLPSYIEVEHISSKKSVVHFISAEGGESARKRVQSAAIDLIIIDEEIDGEIFTELNVRTLATDGEIIISASLLKSEQWILELEEAAERGDPEYLLTRLNTDLNTHLSERSKNAVFGNMSEEEKEVRKYGKSRRRHGLVYPEFDEKLHVVEPFIIPDEWPKYMALDPGYRTFAGLWIAKTPENKFVAYRELYLHATNLQDVADFIKIKETEQIALRLIDPNAKKHMEDGRVSIMTQLSQFYNLHMCPANNDEIAGVMACHRMLNVENGIPNMVVFSTCINFLKERRQYKLSKEGPVTANDKPVQKFNHLMDCWKYLSLHLVGYTMGIKIKPRKDQYLTETDHRRKNLERVLLDRKNITVHPILGSNF